MVRGLKRYSRKKGHKFHAKLDDTTSISFYQKEVGTYCIIKKDLIDYDVYIAPSDAPITHDIFSQPNPYENTVADISIFENEILPIVEAVHDQFGEDKFLSLDKIALAVGSSENDYVTIDETDLLDLDVEPSLQGLIDFIHGHEDGVTGFCERKFQPEKGTQIFFESSLRNPDKNIKSIDISIISSLHQRGLYLQKHHQYYGLQLYIVIKCDKINDAFLELLTNLEIDWELLFLRRDLSLADWTEIECERRSFNLKGYLKSKYSSLGFFDINNITRLVVRNQLSFKVAKKIADLLNNAKLLREQGFVSGEKNEPLNKAEIAAAAELALAYYGHSEEIKLQYDRDVSVEEVQHYMEELIKI